MTEVLRVARDSEKSFDDAAPPAREAGALLRMVEEQKISLNAAKTAFAAMVKSGNSAAKTIAELGLAQVPMRKRSRLHARQCSPPSREKSPNIAPAATNFLDSSSRSDESDGREGQSQSHQRRPAQEASRRELIGHKSDNQP